MALLAATLAAILFVPGNTVWAQGEGQEECNFSLVVEDATCTTASECAVSTFTAPCTRTNYRLTCEVLCSEGDPADCRITATVARLSDGLVKGVCQNWDEQDCAAGQGIVPDVALEEGVTYKLTVCLFPCYWSTCEECENAARAELSR